MPGRCSCAGSSCGCLVVGGNGMQVSGSGTATAPFMVSLAPAAGAIVHTTGALDLSAYSGFASILVTLNANTTDLLLPPDGGVIELVILQGTGGSRTIAWPAAIKFPGGTNPVLSTVVGRYDWVRLVYAGGIWVGELIGTNLS